jgi:hypothetical protein
MNILDLLKKASKDLLPGGQADNMPDSKFNKKKLHHAQKHEMEHTKSPAIAKEVAKDHMLEDENYYKKIEKIEKLGKLLKLATMRSYTASTSDADVTTPAAEDVAFLSAKNNKPKSKTKASKPNSNLRNALIKATENTFGNNPSMKKGSKE